MEGGVTKNLYMIPLSDKPMLIVATVSIHWTVVKLSDGKLENNIDNLQANENISP